MVQAKIPLAGGIGDNDLAHVSEMLSRSYDVEGVTFDGMSISVRVRDETSPAELQRTLRQILRVHRFASQDCIFTHVVEDWDNGDCQPALEATGDVRSIGPGLFAFQGDFLRVRMALDGCVRAIAARCGAQELSYPPLWPVPLLQAINYFHDFPQLAMLAVGVTPEYKARSAFADRFKKGVGTHAIACTEENGLAPARNALAPTVCDCCYWLLRGRRDVEDHVSTVYGTVFRNETSPEGRLDRLTVYTMREIVAVGQEAFVLAQREAWLGEVERLVTELDLACSIKAADDPFFSNDALQKNAYQALSQLKYEVQVSLYGDRKTAVVSINLHNDYFSQSYDFEGKAGRPISACVGFGYERLTYALFCRHGRKVSAWPGAVRAALGLS